MDKRENKKIKKQKVSETRDLENETNNKIIYPPIYLSFRKTIGKSFA